MAVAVGQSKPDRSGNRLLSNEVACGEKRDRGLLAAFRNDSEFGAALLEVENGVAASP